MGFMFFWTFWLQTKFWGKSLVYPGWLLFSIAQKKQRQRCLLQPVFRREHSRHGQFGVRNTHLNSRTRVQPRLLSKKRIKHDKKHKESKNKVLTQFNMSKLHANFTVTIQP